MLWFDPSGLDSEKGIGCFVREFGYGRIIQVMATHSGKACRAGCEAAGVRRAGRRVRGGGESRPPRRTRRLYIIPRNTAITISDCPTEGVKRVVVLSDGVLAQGVMGVRLVESGTVLACRTGVKIARFWGKSGGQSEAFSGQSGGQSGGQSETGVTALCGLFSDAYGHMETSQEASQMAGHLRFGASQVASHIISKK